MDEIDKTVESIEAKIVELCVKEIPSRQIGDFLMEALKGLDKVAYIRFASVYREFTDISQFVDTLKSLDVLKSKSNSENEKKSSRQKKIVRK